MNRSAAASSHCTGSRPAAELASTAGKFPAEITQRALAIINSPKHVKLHWAFAEGGALPCREI